MANEYLTVKQAQYLLEKWKQEVVQKAGDTMTGRLILSGGLSLTTASYDSDPPYYLGLTESFADGGTVGWSSKNDVKTALGVVTLSQASVNASAVNVTTATDTTLCHTAALEAGAYYILLGTATFPQNTTGRRAIFFATSNTGANIDRYSRVVHASSNGGAQLQLVYICYPSQSTTYYLRAYQNSGSTQSVTNGGIRVFKFAL